MFKKSIIINSDFYLYTQMAIMLIRKILESSCFDNNLMHARSFFVRKKTVIFKKFVSQFIRFQF